MSNNEVIGRALDCLKRGLERFVKQQMGRQWEKIVNGGIANGELHFDAQALLDIIKNHWPQVFRPALGHDRSGLIKEVRKVRNRWAHQESFSPDEVMGALKAIHQLLVAVHALAEARQVEELIGPIKPVLVVTTWEQIQQNLLRLEAYRRSQESQEAKFYKGLIKRGICFVVYKRGEELLFGPSRFVGYVNNNLPTHHANVEKDGKITNPAIDQIIGSLAKTTDFLEGEYLRLCTQLEIIAKPEGNFAVTRRYWFKY